MDAQKSSSLFKAPVFTILAGDSGVVYHVHTSVLCKSPVLSKVVEGDWSETREKTLFWKQWSVDGVEKLLAWLYTGDYQCPLPAKIVTLEEADSASSQLSDSGKAGSKLTPTLDGAKRATKNQKRINENGTTSPSNPPSDLIDLGRKTAKTDGTAALPSISALDGPDPGSDSKISEATAFEVWSADHVRNASEWQWEATLMTHAELYVMACHYELWGLKAMSWQRLRTIFNVFGSPKRGSAIYDVVIKLVPYVYEETGTVGNEDDPLRRLVSTFAAQNFTEIQGVALAELFVSATESVKDFIVDLNNKVAIRMKSSAGQIFYPRSGVHPAKYGPVALGGVVPFAKLGSPRDRPRRLILHKDSPSGHRLLPGLGEIRVLIFHTFSTGVDENPSTKDAQNSAPSRHEYWKGLAT
ncbi:MAG: hypothetical protein Q9183_003997 [Haloplaca sp. 2 TL-2023]